MEESGILGVLTARDGLILLTVAELAAPGENREFSKTPVALLRMADRGIIVELKLSRDLVVGRIADYCRLVEIAMD